jgi:isoleucyl-tRNA synthetase
VHAVQSARKRAGLDISDRIELRLSGDEDLLQAARAHQEYVANETLATSISYDGAADVEPVKVAKRELRISVSKSG